MNLKKIKGVFLTMVIMVILSGCGNKININQPQNNLAKNNVTNQADMKENENTAHKEDNVDINNMSFKELDKTKWLDFKNDDYGYEIKYPSSWTALSSLGLQPANNYMLFTGIENSTKVNEAFNNNDSYDLQIEKLNNLIVYLDVSYNVNKITIEDVEKSEKEKNQLAQEKIIKIGNTEFLYSINKNSIGNYREDKVIYTNNNFIYSLYYFSSIDTNYFNDENFSIFYNMLETFNVVDNSIANSQKWSVHVDSKYKFSIELPQNYLWNKKSFDLDNSVDEFYGRSPMYQDENIRLKIYSFDNNDELNKNKKVIIGSGIKDENSPGIETYIVNKKNEYIRIYIIGNKIYYLDIITIGIGDEVANKIISNFNIKQN